MKYVPGGQFPSEHLSIQETLAEIADTVAIAKIAASSLCETKMPETKKELDLIIKNLAEAESYLPHIRHKVDVALEYVPDDVKKKHFL